MHGFVNKVADATPLLLMLSLLLVLPTAAPVDAHPAPSTAHHHHHHHPHRNHCPALEQLQRYVQDSCGHARRRREASLSHASGGPLLRRLHQSALALVDPKDLPAEVRLARNYQDDSIVLLCCMQPCNVGDFVGTC